MAEPFVEGELRSGSRRATKSPSYIGSIRMLESRLRFLVAAIVAAGAFASPVSAELIHHYEFDSDSTDSIGGVDGALVGNASVSGGLLVLGGAGYVQYPQHIIPVASSYTVALFAREDALGGAGVEFVSQGASVPDSCTVGGFYLGYAIASQSGVDRGIRATDCWRMPMVAFPDDGEIHHVALVVDALVPESRLYLDGVRVATRAGAIETTSSGSSTRLGRQFDPFNEYLTGAIDDVRVYDHALSDEEIANIASPATVSALGPTALALLSALVIACTALTAPRRDSVAP